MFNSKVFFAELIGTFALVFIGAGAGIAGAGLLGVALAHGLTVATFAYTFGYISGTHINPAVTLGLWAVGKLKGDLAFVSYVIPQLIGSIFAALLLKLFFGDISNGATVGSLSLPEVFAQNGRFYPLVPMAVEAILTFFLMNAILHNAVGGKSGQLAGLVIGLTLTVSILLGGTLTGASLNPARTFGPAIFSSPSLIDRETYIIYLFGPLIGSLVAVFAYRFFTDAKDEEEPAPVEKVEKPKRVVRKTTTKK